MRTQICLEGSYDNKCKCKECFEITDTIRIIKEFQKVKSKYKDLDINNYLQHCKDNNIKPDAYIIEQIKRAL